MRAKKRERAPYKPAIEDATARDRGVVVSAARARWKAKHMLPSEKVIRMVRFIWMRDLRWEDRTKLNSQVLGAAMRWGYVWREPEHEKSRDLMMAIDPRHIDRRNP